MATIIYFVFMQYEQIFFIIQGCYVCILSNQFIFAMCIQMYRQCFLLSSEFQIAFQVSAVGVGQVYYTLIETSSIFGQKKGWMESKCHSYGQTQQNLFGKCACLAQSFQAISWPFLHGLLLLKHRLVEDGLGRFFFSFRQPHRKKSHGARFVKRGAHAKYL